MKVHLARCVAVCLLAVWVAGSAAAEQAQRTVRIDGVGRAELVLRGGQSLYLVEVPGSPPRAFSPDDFATWSLSPEALEPAPLDGWLYHALNISSPAGLAWVAVGVAGQLLFAARMLVQWLASERAKRSVIPVAFWWISLGGASMLLAYFLWRRDAVGVLGQLTGWVIYARNLALIRREHGPSQVD